MTTIFLIWRVTRSGPAYVKLAQSFCSEFNQRDFIQPLTISCITISSRKRIKQQQFLVDKIQSQPSIAPPELFNWEEKFGPEWSSESIPLEIFPGNEFFIRVSSCSFVQATPYFEELWPIGPIKNLKKTKLIFKNKKYQ